MLDQEFDSVAELSDLAVGWNADFRQLGSEKFPSEIFQAKVSSLLLSNARFGCSVDQRGTTPEGMRTFAVPNADCSEISWFGRRIEPDCILAFPVNGEISGISRPGFNVSSFSISEQLLKDLVQRSEMPNLGILLTSSATAVPVSHEQIRPLRYLLAQAQKLAGISEEMFDHDALYDELQDQILLSTLELLSCKNTVANPRYRKSRRSLTRLLGYIEAHSNKPLRVSALCAVAQVSQRTLQALFKQEFGMTLKAYLTGQRLYGVHRELWLASRPDVRVSEVAKKWGFWHMSQFAIDYRRIFDELPSQTLAGSL